MASPEFLKALDALQRGKVVAAATDTLIGLLVDASSSQAIDQLAAIKGRAPDQAFALIGPNLAHVSTLLRLNGEAMALASEHWPGPLTLVAEAHAAMDTRLMLNGKVGIRVPAACDASALCIRLGRCLTATSANFPGQKAPSHTDELDPELQSAIESVGGVVLRGRAPGGPPSTLVDVSEGLRVLRAGPIVIRVRES